MMTMKPLNNRVSHLVMVGVIDTYGAHLCGPSIDAAVISTLISTHAISSPYSVDAMGRQPAGIRSLNSGIAQRLNSGPWVCIRMRARAAGNVHAYINIQKPTTLRKTASSCKLNSGRRGRGLGKLAAVRGWPDTIFPVFMPT